MTDFRKMIAARFFFNLAVSVQAVTVGWRMFELTREPLSLGLIGLAEAVPALTLAIFAGYLVDRSRPQRIYLFVLVTSLASAGVVFVSQLDALAVPRDAQVYLLYLASFATGLARGFSQPATYAVTPRLLPRAELARGVAVMGSILQSANVLGPAVGGLVFGWCGVRWASALPCLCLVAAIAAWQMIGARIPAPTRGSRPTRVRDELLSGAAFVFKHPILLPALSLDMLSVLFGGVEALLPVFAADVLLVGAKGLGVLRAAPAVGAVLAGILLTRIDVRPRAGHYLLGSVVGFGACILVFGLSQNFWLSLAMLALSGAFDGVSATIRSTAVQLVSPDHLRGRISAVNSIFIGSSNELGEFESGLAAHLLGTVPAVTLGALACLTVVAFVTARCPSLRGLNLRSLEDEGVNSD